MRKKTANLTDDQAEWFEENALNFSAWVRQKVEAAMDK